MSIITKEWLRSQISAIKTVGITDSNTLQAFEIALASLEAEPVAYIFKHPAGRLFWSLTDESNKGQSDVMPVYTAPPAPVSVPDGYRLQPISEYDAMCAAMLHGADGNSPVIGEGRIDEAI